MIGRISMITGATSGIGRETALGLARMGSSVVMVGRDKVRGEAARDEIRAQSGNSNVHLLLADLSSQQAIRQLVVEFKEFSPHLHVLVNNAGVAPIKRSVTADGIETTLAVNYLAPFLLTNLLLDVIEASAPARIVNVAGDYHRKATIQFNDLMAEKEYSYTRANNQAKLALILFTYELARRLNGSGVTVNCLHPGAVATNAPLKDPDLPIFGRMMYSLVKPFFATPAKGAETSIYLASSPEVAAVSSKYFIRKAPVASSPESYNQEIARRLWSISEELTGLVGKSK